MKKLLFRRFLSLFTIVSFAVFAGCSNDNTATPNELTVDQTSIEFDGNGNVKNGKSATINVKSISTWNVLVDNNTDNNQWFELSTTTGTGDGSITVKDVKTNSMSGDRSARLSISTANVTQYVTVRQTDLGLEADILSVDFGTDGGNYGMKPSLISDFGVSGYAADDIEFVWDDDNTFLYSATYTMQGAGQILTPSWGYKGYSAYGMVMFGAVPWVSTDGDIAFEIKNIVTGGQTAFTINFSILRAGGAYLSESIEPSEFILSYSANGSAYTTIPYTLETDSDWRGWNLATVFIESETVIDALSLKFEAKKVGKYVLDDVKVTGAGIFTEPIAVTEEVEGLNVDRATLVGSYTVSKSSNVTDAGFYWGIDDIDTKVKGTISGQTFTYALTDLEEDFEYKYASYIVVNGKEYKGQTITFKTYSSALTIVKSSVEGLLMDQKESSATIQIQYADATPTVEYDVTLKVIGESYGLTIPATDSYMIPAGTERTGTYTIPITGKPEGVGTLEIEIEGFGVNPITVSKNIESFDPYIMSRWDLTTYDNATKDFDSPLSSPFGGVLNQFEEGIQYPRLSGTNNEPTGRGRFGGAPMKPGIEDYFLMSVPVGSGFVDQTITVTGGMSIYSSLKSYYKNYVLEYRFDEYSAWLAADTFTLPSDYTDSAYTPFDFSFQTTGYMSYRTHLYIRIRIDGDETISGTEFTGSPQNYISGTIEVRKTVL